MRILQQNQKITGIKADSHEGLRKATPKRSKSDDSNGVLGPSVTPRCRARRNRDSTTYVTVGFKQFSVFFDTPAKFNSYRVTFCF